MNCSDYFWQVNFSNLLCSFFLLFCFYSNVLNKNLEKTKSFFESLKVQVSSGFWLEISNFEISRKKEIEKKDT